MSEQHQHSRTGEQLQPPAGAEDAGAGADRLAATRAELDRVYAAADAILEGIRLGNSVRFLEQIRQSGGE